MHQHGVAVLHPAGVVRAGRSGQRLVDDLDALDGGVVAVDVRRQPLHGLLLLLLLRRCLLLLLLELELRLVRRRRLTLLVLQLVQRRL